METKADSVQEQAQDPAPAASKEEILQQQVSVAHAFASLATTRVQRASKLLEAGDVAGLREELLALEDLIQKIARELA